MVKMNLFSCLSMQVFVLVATSLSPAAEGGAGARNVLLLIGDDHGLELGCYGHPVIKTPNLDRLAAGGVRFTQAYTTVASCSPSRSVIYTGLYTHTSGQYGLQHGYHNFATAASVKSLPGVLRDRGYRTGVIAKLHVQPATVYPFETVLPMSGRNPTAIAKAVAEFLAGGRDKPFFLAVGFTDPHRSKSGFGEEERTPGVPAVEYRPEEVVVPRYLPDTPTVRKDLALYYRSISRLDAGVGKVLEALDAAGATNSTLVIYVSDNGPPFPGAKTTVYDPGIHLPLIVRSPSLPKGGLANDAMVNWADIVPTLLDWAGVKPPPLPGRSLLPILDQPHPAGWDMIFASHTFHEVTMYYPMRAIRTREYKYILNVAHKLDFPFASDLYGSPTWQEVLAAKPAIYAVRTVDQYVHRPREELYHVSTDPDEAKNLAGDPKYAPVLDDLRARLKDWQKQTKDPWIIKYEHE